MTCSVAQEMLGAYFDGELNASAELEIRIHVASCHRCSEQLERMRNLQLQMRRGNLSYEAPVRLEERIRSSLGLPATRPADWRRWLALAAAVVLVSTLSIRLWVLRRNVDERIAQQVVSSHVRALLTGHVADVASTDRHTVKPWFNGRIDFSPQVKDFAQQGFPLTGGRVDYLDNRSVAALVYARRRHSIDVFIWPSKEKLSGKSSTNGYNTLLWSEGGMAYAAVSDLNALELDEFRQLFAR